MEEEGWEEKGSLLLTLGNSRAARKLHVHDYTQQGDLGWRHHILIFEDEATGELSEV